MTAPQDDYMMVTGQSEKTGLAYPVGRQQVELLIDTKAKILDTKTGKDLWKSFLSPAAQYRICDLTKTPLPVTRKVQ